MPNIKVDLGKRSYPIIIGEHNTDRLIKALDHTVKGNRLFVFYDANFYALHGVTLSKLLKKYKPLELVIPSGEKSKSQNQLSKLYNYILDQKVSRTDFILAVGGGVTSDLIGYLAATTLRGIKWGVVSTTLLGMVDAAIGGKTGINSKQGKNLIGAFWQPSFVFCDTFYLNTLSKREYNCGLGEIVKYAGLIGGEYLDLLQRFLENPSNTKLTEKLITASARYKADIVSRDEREGKLRMYLNFGHTVGHAIEKEIGYNRIKHGEAVLLGLWVAVELSLMKLKSHRNEMLRYQNLIESYLALIPTFKLMPDSIFKAISSDKKRASGKQNYILIRKPGKPIIIDSLNPILIKKAIKGLIERYSQIGARNA